MGFQQLRRYGTYVSESAKVYLHIAKSIQPRVLNYTELRAYNVQPKLDQVLGRGPGQDEVFVMFKHMGGSKAEVDKDKAHSFVYAPSFEEFYDVPLRAMTSSSPEAFLDTFCRVSLDDGIRWSRSLMGQRFGHWLNGKREFPDYFPFFVTTLQRASPFLPLAKIHLVRMTRDDDIKIEFAYPSINYFNTGSWHCAMKTDYKVKVDCQYDKEMIDFDSAQHVLFAMPCGHAIACSKHAEAVYESAKISQKSRLPTLFAMPKFSVDSLICPVCNRLATALFTSKSGLKYDYDSHGSKSKGVGLLSAILFNWMCWLKML